MPVENGVYVDPMTNGVTVTFATGDAPQLSFEHSLDKALAEIKRMLIEKNRAYGNSALDPVRVFSKADAGEQLRVRIDDKLSRMMRGDCMTEDTVLDLLGYLVLLRIADGTSAR